MISHAGHLGKTDSQPGNLLDEADIGSGEITPGQSETQKQIDQVPQRGSQERTDKKSPPKPNSSGAEPADGGEQYVNVTPAPWP